VCVSAKDLGPDAKRRISTALATLSAGLSGIRQFTRHNENWQLGSVDECRVNVDNGQLVVPLRNARIPRLSVFLEDARRRLGASIDFSDDERGGGYLITWDLPEAARSTCFFWVRTVFGLVLAVACLVFASYVYRKK